MACKKSELIAAINAFGSARSTGDRTLIEFSGNLLGELIETLDFAPEGELSVETEDVETEVV